MIATTASFKQRTALASLVLTGVALCTNHAVALGYKRGQPAPVVADQCAVQYQTAFNAGEGAEELQVHIGGPTRNILEAYYAHNYLTDIIKGYRDLHVYGQVYMGKPASGTFLVQYGQSHEKFVAYGFYRKNELVKITNDPANWKPNRKDDQMVSLTPGHPISFTWISTRVLKITHGLDGSVTTVIRFNADNGTWSLLDGTKSGGTPIAGPGPPGVSS